MYSTTLRGVFPEPKPVYRRNFIKENVKSIKQMQGILQDAGVIQPRKKSIQDRYRNVPRHTKSRESNASRSLGNLSANEVRATEQKPAMKPSHVTSIKSQLSKAAVKAKKEDISRRQQTKKKDISATVSTIEESRLTHRAMQTERQEDLSRLYDTGVIKYPSPSVLTSAKNQGQGDHIENVSQEMENLTVEDKDFIKENKNIKPRQPKQSPVKVMAQAPPNYQRGVVPKYLKDRREDSPIEPDAECPMGHILLPEEERKETLRVLRQSYADRVQELNMMPVRNDTLKMRKRKMDIEEELKRIDGGIKVFQRPKVFVKINA